MFMKLKKILTVVGIAWLVSAFGVSSSESSKSGINCGHVITDNKDIREYYNGKVRSEITVSLPKSLIEKSVDLEMSDESQPGSASVKAVLKTLNGQEVVRSGQVFYFYKNGKVGYVDNTLQETCYPLCTIDPVEFEADFGKYPDISCELVN